MQVERQLGQRGFTLVELVTVVAIVGVLASIAMPNLMPMLYRTRRAEAHHMLNAIYKAQISHYAQAGRYSDSFAEIGVVLDGGTVVDSQTIEGRHYTYTLASIDGGRNFMATASGDIAPGDSMNDVLIIRNDVTIVE